MTEVSFYHLEREPLDRALPKLLEKVAERGLRAVVIAGSEARVEALNEYLWTYRRDGFLAHGAARDGHAAEQPIYLTTEEQNPNGATVLILVDGADAGFKATFDRCLDLFDGTDPDALGEARQRWRAAKAAGFDLTYWQQGPGGWEKKAEAAGA